MNAKQKEIDKLQKDLVRGTGAEDVLVDLQEKLTAANKEIKKLEAKRNKLEKQKKNNSLHGDDGEKKLKKLEATNRILEKENEGKQDKIDELQVRMVQGSGDEGLLKDLMNDLSKVNERNKELEIRNAELEEDRNCLLSSEGMEGNTASLKEENERLEAANENTVEKLEKLQKDLVNGTGCEELLRELQNEVKELGSKNEELRRNERGKENTGPFTREGKDLKQLEKELNKVNLEKKRLNSDNDKKEKEIVGLQKKLVAGSGGEEILADLQEKIRTLEEESKIMAMQCHDAEEMAKDLLDKKEDNKKLGKELLRAKKENEKLVQENESKEKEICELQKSIVHGSGAEELLKTLQDKIRETTETNKMLEKKCSDLESNVNRIGAVGIERDDKLYRPEITGLAKAKIEVKRLTRECGGKDQEIVELQRKLMSGNGGEKILQSLQGQVKGLQETNNNLERKLAITRNHEIAPKGMEKKEKEYYEQRLQIIPQITDEKDHWREKYKVLRMKIGEQFVDSIPEVWNEETMLEKEREKAVLQLSEIRQEISDKETPVMKTVSEKEKIETELRKVEDELDVCRENLELLRGLAEEEELIEKNEKKLVECLYKLEPNLDSSLKSGKKGEKRSEVLEGDIIRHGSESDALERNVSHLFNEMDELLSEEQDLENKQNLEKNIVGLVDEKIDTENEIKEIELAINNLRKGLCSHNGALSQNNQSKDINNELEKIQQEINILQSSHETPSGQEVNNLIALMKEKSRLEDELTNADKSLNQLGKRDYEALVKERETQEKVAKKLLELSREKEVAEAELQKVEALANEKENELLESFNTEMKSKEVLETPSKKKRGFGKKKSSSKLKSEDPGKISSSKEGSFSSIDLGDPPLSSDATLALTKELGSLIQKKSSLAVRLEGMDKEITAQSLKVEKSLLGVKDDSNEEPSSSGSSFTSMEDLTQSQMSLFDDFGMVDELSLATNVVKEERAKRKSSRKAPMSKLLREKSTLEKRLKESQGKVLVQNTKIKNALGEGKDAEKAKEKFVQAVGERKAMEKELANVCTKVDELASEEDSIKEKSRKKGKTLEKKSGKSFSKNDKRRLLSQRESLRQQLDNIKKKIENFSTDGEDAGLADFPEMGEVGSIGNTVGKLRELIAREAELKQDLDRLTRGGDPATLNGSLSGSTEATGSILDNGGELGKRDDKEVHVKGTTSDSGVPREGSNKEEMSAERLRRLGDRRESSSSMGEFHRTNDDFTAIQTGKESLLGKDSKIQKNTSVSSQVPYSKDIKQNSEQGGKIVDATSTPFSDLVDLLVKEKASKEAKLSDLEKSIENEKSGCDKNEEAARVFKRKREDLRNKMEYAFNELEQRKAVLDESRDLLRKSDKDDSVPSEALLAEDYNALTEEREKLEKQLMATKVELNMQTQNEEDLEGISAKYQGYKELKDREKVLNTSLEKINEDLRRRKEWAAMDSSEQDGPTLGASYENVVKRMSEENLNMVDLIQELDETKETLSKEREITSELLELIKSRVGDELLEALMREGLHSPSAEMREMGFLGGNGHQELLDKVDNDNVTVEELIGDYKKVNQFLYKENQKLHEKIESLKSKVDEDLLALIAEQEPTDVDISKKHDISKILENNKTLFEQIVITNIQNEANEERLQIMEDENKSLKIELEDVRKTKVNEEKKKFKEKVDNISIVLDEAKKREKELAEELEKLEKDSSRETLAFESFTTEVSGSSIGDNELQNEENTTKEENTTNEENESIKQDQGEICQEISSRLKEAEKLGWKMDSELNSLKNALAETITETDVPVSSVRIRRTMKQSEEVDLLEEHGSQDEASRMNMDGRRHSKDNIVLRNEGLKRGNQNEESRVSENDWGNDEDNEVFREDDERLNRKVFSVQDLQKAYAVKLDEVQELQQALKRNLDRKELDSEVKKMATKDSKLKEIGVENNALKKELARIETDTRNMKDELSNLEKENEEIKSEIKEVETKNKRLTNDLEVSQQVEDENKELKAKTQCLRDEIKESIAKFNEAIKQKDAIVEKFEDLQKEYISIKETLGSLQKENSELNEKVDGLKNNIEEFSASLMESQTARDEIAVVLENVETERESLKEKISSLEEETDELKKKLFALQNENEEISARLKGANENNKEMEKDVEDLKLENKSFEELLDLQKKENSNLQEEIRELENKNEEADEKRKEIDEDLKKYEKNNKILEEKLGLLENDNKELNDQNCVLVNENKEVIVKLNEAIVEKKKGETSLQDLEKETKSLKETLALLENENNEMIPKLDELEKVRKELEDEVEYLRKENKDFETMGEKLKETETVRENVQEELEVLKRENKEVEDFVHQDLNQNTVNGVKSALEKYREKCTDTEEQNTFLKEEVETLGKLQRIVGKSFSKNLLDLSEDGLALKDTQDNPRCLEKLIKDKNTLASILKEFEDDLDEVKQHLGEELFSLIVCKYAGLGSKERRKPLKIVDELKNGKHIKEIVKEYEDLMDSQANDLENAEHLQQNVRLMEEELAVLRKQRDVVSDKAKTLEDELDVQNCEYQELLRRIIEHKTEIEEADELLREQRAKHEHEKENMTKQFNAEKTNMQRFISNERNSMEKAMQNLVNEIVRLKEERNEIRKNNRLEKEKLAVAFENERAEALSSNEVMKNEVQEKLEKRFQDDLEKAKKEMQAREAELEEELMKLRTERSDLVSKVAEIEDTSENGVTINEGNETSLALKERESREQIKNEFEEKMNVEKKRFQETLNALRQEVERLQNERRKAMNEISTTQEEQLKQTTDFSTSEAQIYERLETEFKTKTNSEKMIVESRIKELRKENEVLNQQKQELKSSMRMERLEMSKKHEREKEELAEKYRNELKTLRKNLEKSQVSQEVSSLPTQNFYELRRKIRDRDAKIKRYETFFQELNQEASILQRDSDMAV